jgi:hypothetical protein
MSSRVLNRMRMMGESIRSASHAAAKVISAGAMAVGVVTFADLVVRHEAVKQSWCGMLF